MENELLIRTAESAKQAHKRIDTLEHNLENTDNKIENIYELTISVKEIATEMKAMREDMAKIDDRVKSIEDKPAKRYDAIVGQVISIIVAGVVGFFLAKFGI